MVRLKPIGVVRHNAGRVPRHWSLSSLEGEIHIQPEYLDGLKDIRPGQRLVVLFHFHKSPAFRADRLVQTPPHRDTPLGVFSICSPVRPNPLGLSVVEVLEISGTVLRVRGLDMLDQTPVLDLKPQVGSARDCPSWTGDGKEEGN